MRSFLLTIPAFLFGIMTNAQIASSFEILSRDKQIDSLVHILKVSPEDTGKVNTIFGLGILYYKNDKYDDLLRLGNQALQLSKQLNYNKGKGLSYLLFSKYYHNKKKYNEAFKNIFVSLNLLKSEDDKNGIANCYLHISRLHLNLGNSNIATRYQDSALWLFHILGKKKEEADLYIVKATTSTYLGENGSALESNYAALNIYEKLGDQSGIGSALGSIGFAYYGNKDDSLAQVFLIEACEIFKKENDIFGYADNIMTLGDLKLDQGRYGEAMKFYQEGFEIFHLPGAKKTGIPWSYDCFARVYLSIGDSANTAENLQVAENNYKKALLNFSVSLEKYSNLKFVLAIAQAKLFIGEVNFKLGKYQLAKNVLREALAGLRNSEMNEPMAKVYLYLSKIDSVEGNFVQAYKNFQLYSLYIGKLVNSSITKKVEVYKARDRIQQKEKEIKLLESENALKTTLAEKQKQQKQFAYAGIAVVMGLSGYGFFRYRRRKKTEMEKVQMKDRLHISQGLHDDIGSTLSSISVYSQVAQRLSEKNEKEEMIEMLGKISNTSNEMVSEMSDIVWAINPKNDNMEKILQRMVSFARPMLATRNISFRINYEPDILNTNLDMEKRKDFYLIFKEAVNNAFKYSGCSEISADLTRSKRHLKLIIKDNGVGFDVQHEIAGNKLTLSGNGLRNMKSRAEEMKGDLSFYSTPGEGVELKLSFPIT